MSGPSPSQARARTLVGVSTLSALASATGASAGIVLFDTSSVTSNTFSGSVSWDIDGAGSAEARFANDSFSSSYFYKNLFPANTNSFKVQVQSGYLVGLAEDVVVSAGGVFSRFASTVSYSGGLSFVTNISSGTPTFGCN